MTISNPNVTHITKRWRATAYNARNYVSLKILLLSILSLFLLLYLEFLSYSLQTLRSFPVSGEARYSGGTDAIIEKQHTMPLKNYTTIGQMDSPLDILIATTKNVSMDAIIPFIDKFAVPATSNITVDQIDAAIIKNTIGVYGKKNKHLLGCNDIAKLELLRPVGRGSSKSVYEVKLPSGQHAVVKRCWQEQCVITEALIKEAELVRDLYEQYGDEVLRYFGECNATYKDTRTRSLKKSGANFSDGFTLVVELGMPMIPDWSMKDTKCFAEFYTESDIEDFVTIARQFANFSKSPVILRIPEKSDNKYPQQYISSIGGSNEGRIKLVDLDYLDICKSGKKKSNGKKCTFDTVLDTNCKIMAKLTNIPTLNCSLSGSDSSRKKNFQSFPKNRINASHALMECKRREVDLATKQHLLATRPKVTV